MRSEDRNIHANNYPTLHYPELYLLEGGYKALFEYSTVSLVFHF
jgi:M-phase inducer phosphatase 2